MTEEVESSTIAVTTTTNNDNKSQVDDNIVNQPHIVKEKKKKSAFGFLKAATLKLRRRSLDLKQQKFSLQKETVAPADSKGENWKKLVGSMRPLHLQDNQSPPSPPELPPPMKTTSLPVEFNEHFSSLYSLSPSTSSVGTMSQYASANNLQELDNEKEEDPDHVFDAIGADDMIDTKAENFIAQFYEQMRLQQ